MIPVRYRNFIINYDPPPIPVRDHDYHWVHEDYDGPEDSRLGSSASLKAAFAEIDLWYEEHSADTGSTVEPERQP